MNDNLAERLLDDRRSGLQTDADGRRYFRSRRVRFETIDVHARDLFTGGWLGFETDLVPPAWHGNPSHREIRDFAHEASKRFHAFWYRVFDVAAARSLAGRGIEIFQQPFLIPNTLFDIGIPDEQELSSVPPLLHAKILAEYTEARDAPVRYRIFYLSNYLRGITDDVSEILRPFRDLWRLKERRLALFDELDAIQRNLDAVFPKDFERAARERIDAVILERLETIARERGERHIEHASIRQLVHRKRQGDLNRLTRQERDEVLRRGAEIGLSTPALNLHRALSLSRTAQRTARSAASLASNVYRLELRMARLVYLQRGQDEPDERSVDRNASLAERRKRFLDLFDVRYKQCAELTGDSQKLTVLRALLHYCAEHSDHDPLAIFTVPPPLDAAEQNAASADARQLARYPRLLQEIRALDRELVRFHEDYARREAPKAKPAPTESAEPEEPELPVPQLPEEPQLWDGPERYPGGLDVLDTTGHVPGNPYDEPVLVARARDLILRRLRPVRRTANFYSLNPGHRHGAITLNPIMKLWKDRPEVVKDAPRLTGLEMNTKETVECLLRLVSLADPELANRPLRRERIVREMRGIENLANLTMFLLPGSCYPLREIAREDFPEFRGRVIGESRSPLELGVDPREDAVLTGGWYQKFNHTLYYPVGGDHGRLVRLIWNSGRSPGPPAFLFALGQFVHDCLEDPLIYYRTTEKTFRECVEEYYREEDRIRKNRGERFGRRRLDNSRAGVRFMFAVHYARLIMEALTGSSQSHFRHTPTEIWFMNYLALPVLTKSDRHVFQNIRKQAREIIESYGMHGT